MNLVSSPYLGPCLPFLALRIQSRLPPRPPAAALTPPPLPASPSRPSQADSPLSLLPFGTRPPRESLQTLHLPFFQASHLTRCWASLTLPVDSPWNSSLPSSCPKTSRGRFLPRLSVSFPPDLSPASGVSSPGVSLPGLCPPCAGPRPTTPLPHPPHARLHSGQSHLSLIWSMPRPGHSPACVIAIS